MGIAWKRIPTFSYEIGDLDLFHLRSKHDALEGLSDIRQDPDYWINISLADYYGVDRIQGYYEE
ncbi:MAG: hypothetical protein K2J67_08570 [Lachnospiraceae bacterium]|nr:hypothetical protein [Lachnospiraceae bacterium]